jgi:hypothetical protein
VGKRSPTLRNTAEFTMSVLVKIHNQFRCRMFGAQQGRLCHCVRQHKFISFNIVNIATVFNEFLQCVDILIRWVCSSQLTTSQEPATNITGLK